MRMPSLFERQGLELSYLGKGLGKESVSLLGRVPLFQRGNYKGVKPTQI